MWEFDSLIPNQKTAVAFRLRYFRGIAQLVARLVRDEEAVGSNPAAPTKKKQTHVCVSAFCLSEPGFEQGGGIIVLQVRVTDRFGEETGAAAKDEMRGVRNVCDGVALREVRQEGILIKAAELGDGFQQGILCNGMGIPVENALVQRQPAPSVTLALVCS